MAVKRLDHVVIGAGLQALEFILGSCPSRQQDDRNMAGHLVGFDLFTKLNAIHFRHHNVTNDDKANVFL